MGIILGILIGILVGMAIVMYISLEIINQYEEDLSTQIGLRKNRDKFIEKQSKAKNELQEENITLYEENKDLRFENEEFKLDDKTKEKLLQEISRLTTQNTYNNEKAILDKIRELVHDYQSKN